MTEAQLIDGAIVLGSVIVIVIVCVAMDAIEPALRGWLSRFRRGR